MSRNMCKWRHKVRNSQILPPWSPNYLNFFSSKYIYGKFKPSFLQIWEQIIKTVFFYGFFLFSIPSSRISRNMCKWRNKLQNVKKGRWSPFYLVKWSLIYHLTWSLEVKQRWHLKTSRRIIGVHNIFLNPELRWKPTSVNTIFFNPDLRWKPTYVNTIFSDLKPRFSCKSASVNVYHLHQLIHTQIFPLKETSGYSPIIFTVAYCGRLPPILKKMYEFLVLHHELHGDVLVRDHGKPHQGKFL